MSQRLSEHARLLLNSLLHCKDPAWYDVVPDEKDRNPAMDELVRHGLIEVQGDNQGVRATERGKISNRKAKEAGLV